MYNEAAAAETRRLPDKETTRPRQQDVCSQRVAILEYARAHDLASNLLDRHPFSPSVHRLAATDAFACQETSTFANLGDTHFYEPGVLFGGWVCSGGVVSIGGWRRVGSGATGTTPAPDRNERSWEEGRAPA